MILAAAVQRGCGCKCGQSWLAGGQVGKALVLCPRPLNVWVVNHTDSKKRFDCRKEGEEQTLDLAWVLSYSINDAPFYLLPLLLVLFCLLLQG